MLRVVVVVLDERRAVMPEVVLRAVCVVGGGHLSPSSFLFFAFSSSARSASTAVGIISPPPLTLAASAVSLASPPASSGLPLDDSGRALLGPDFFRLRVDHRGGFLGLGAPMVWSSRADAARDRVGPLGLGVDRRLALPAVGLDLDEVVVVVELVQDGRLLEVVERRRRRRLPLERAAAPRVARRLLAGLERRDQRVLTEMKIEKPRMYAPIVES